MQRIVGLDVDGCLSMFNDAYASLLTAHTGIRFPKEDATWPDTWYWERKTGVTREQEAYVWDNMIIPSDRFWQRLPAYPDTRMFLSELVDSDFCDNIYFITSRVGKNVKAQTEYWLDFNGFPRPTVLISKEKGLCAKALKLTHYIDDKNENCVDVLAQSHANTFMLARPWNEDQDGIPRLDTLMQFWEVLREAN